MIQNLYMGNGCFTKHQFKTGSLGFHAQHVFVHSCQANVEQSLGFFTMDVYRHGATAAPMATWGICNPTGLQFDVTCLDLRSFSAFLIHPWSFTGLSSVKIGEHVTFRKGSRLPVIQFHQVLGSA